MARHVKKTTSFAVLHFSVAFGVTYAITGSWQVSGAVALIEPMVNTVAFFFHELVWSRKAAQPALVPGRVPVQAGR
jgi:uncharacterized membrane protein